MYLRPRTLREAVEALQAPEVKILAGGTDFYPALGERKASGTVPEGGSCAKEGDCATGLVCNLTGLNGTCAKPGLGDLGAACNMTSACRAGLVCANGTCQQMTMVMPPPMTGQCFDDEPG